MTKPDSEMMTVEVAYALPQTQKIIALLVKTGTTAIEAITLSGILLKFPEISLADAKIGVFGKIVKGDTPLNAMDRVEIYRPLIADPKQARRLRAAKKENSTAKSGQQKRHSLKQKG